MIIVLSGFFNDIVILYFMSKIVEFWSWQSRYQNCAWWSLRLMKLRLCIKFGTTTNIKDMPLYTPNNILDDTISQMILKAHSLSGCDVTNKKIKQILVQKQKTKKNAILKYSFTVLESMNTSNVISNKLSKYLIQENI